MAEPNNYILNGYQASLKQRNSGYLSKADHLFLENLKENENLPIPLDARAAEWHVLEELQAMTPDNYDLDQLKSYVDALDEMFELYPKTGFIFKIQAKMAPVNQEYIKYLRSLLDKLSKQLREDIQAATLEKLQQALSPEFYSNLQDYTLSPAPEADQALRDLINKRGNEIHCFHNDMNNILTAYVGFDSRKITSSFSRDHNYKKRIDTDAGKLFANLVHHITIIGGYSSLGKIKEAISNKPDIYSKAKGIKQAANVLYSIFNDIQHAYYTEKLENVYNAALLKIYQQHEADAAEVPATFKKYCELILADNSDQVVYNAAFEDLLTKGFSRKFLKLVEHTLYCELKPLLVANQQATENEMKQLKKNLHRFMQASGMHSRLVKQDNTNGSFDDFFKPRYVLSPETNCSNFFIGSAKQQKRRIKSFSQSYGKLTAMLIAIGEGVVSAVALALIIPNAIAAVIIGTVVFLSGFILNRFLFVLDSIGLFNVLGFNRFSTYEDGRALEWYKKGINHLMALISFLGSGLVFFALFISQCMQLVKEFIAHLAPAAQTKVLIVTAVVASPVALAELFGISALIHMANNGLLKKGFKNIWKSICDYLYKHFYVALPQKWDSFSNGVSNLKELLINTPRLIISFVITVTTLGIMAYYMKTLFAFFAAKIAWLMGQIPFLHVGKAAAGTIGQVTGGLNVFVTFKTFTVALGCILVDVLKFSLKLALLAIVMPITALIGFIAVPLQYCQSTNLSVGQVIKNYFVNNFERTICAHAWLTSQSLLIPGGLEYALAKDAHQKEKSSEAKPKEIVNQPTMSEQIFQRTQHYNWLTEKLLYSPSLFFNMLGQACLVVSNGIKLLLDGLHLLTGIIWGVRSFAMNLSGVQRNMAIAQGGYPMQEKTLSSFFQAEQAEQPEQQLVYLTA